MEIIRNLQSIFTSMVHAFFSRKYVQRTMMQGWNSEYKHGDILRDMAKHLLTMRISANHRVAPRSTQPFILPRSIK